MYTGRPFGRAVYRFLFFFFQEVWRFLQELRALSPRLLDWLAALLGLVEALGRWPARLAEGYTALVPKDGPPGALNTRSLTVLSTVYRLWAGLRLEEVILWQDGELAVDCGRVLGDGQLQDELVDEVSLLVYTGSHVGGRTHTAQLCSLITATGRLRK